MATFSYPQNDLDNPKLLLGILGSFWASTYRGNSVLEDLTASRGRTSQEVNEKFLGLVKAISRKSIDVFDKKNWYALSFLESDVNMSQELAEKYSNPATRTYDNETTLDYGDKAGSQYFYLSKPSDLVNANVIHNGIISPKVTLIQGIDFWITDNSVVFAENPFNNSLFAVRDVLSNTGEIVDKEITVWVYRGDYDHANVYNQFGYVLGLNVESSESYKTFVNAIFDAFVDGTSIKSQQMALSVGYGVPFVMEAQETVELIASSSDKLQVITDQHVYNFPPSANPLVSVGDILTAGDAITDTLQVFELNAGKELASAQVSGITVDEGLLAWGFFSGLTFKNEDVAVQVEENVNGYTKISWDLGGFPLDVEKFWADVHSQGISEDKTLAMLLDIRESPLGQPTAASLPSTINPLQFLVDNFLRNNAYIVKLRISKTGDKLPFMPFGLLRKIQPPHTAMILIVELVYADSPVIMESAGTATEPGYEESVGSYPAMVVVEPGTLSSVLSESVKCKLIGGRCI